MEINSEFEYEIDGVNEILVVVDLINVNGSNYVIAENDFGFKKVFIYDIIDEELTLADNFLEEEILEAYDNDEYTALTEDIQDDYLGYTNDDGEYLDYEEEDDLDSSYIIDEEYDDDSVDNDFLESLF